MKLQDLREKRAQVIESAKTIRDGAKAADRDLTQEELDQVTAHLDEAETLAGDITQAEVVEAQSSRLDDAIKDLGQSNGRRTGVVVGDNLAEEDPTGGFRDMGEFGMTVMQSMAPGSGAADERLIIGAAATGMRQGSLAEGGALVPGQFAQTIWDGLNTLADSLLGLTDQYTVEGDFLEFPANAETSRATGSRYGGVRGYWLAEGVQIPNSKPKFRKMRLEPQELAVLVYVTDKLLRNSSTALGQYLTRAATDEINFLVGNSIVDGTGAGQPLGILRSTALVSVAKEGSQPADTIKHENISKMWARLHARSRANAVWFHNVDIDSQLDGLNVPVKNVAGTENVGGFSQRIYNAEKGTIKGRPLVPIEYCKTLGDKGDLILADLSAYATGLRGMIESATSIHLRFDYAESAFRFMFEVDGRPWINAPITPFNGTATLSPFVTLDERA